MLGAVFPEGRCHCRGTFHARGRFSGRSVSFLGDLPGLGLIFRKVRAIPGGPSMLGAVFLEGRCHCRGTFHARGRFSGRSVPLQGDLPGLGLFSRKVGAIPGGPSGSEAVFVAGHMAAVVPGAKVRQDLQVTPNYCILSQNLQDYDSYGKTAGPVAGLVMGLYPCSGPGAEGFSERPSDVGGAPWLLAA